MAADCEQRHADMILRYDVQRGYLTDAVRAALRDLAPEAILQISNLQTARCKRHMDAPLLDGPCGMKRVSPPDDEEEDRPMLIIIGRCGVEWAYEPLLQCERSKATVCARRKYNNNSNNNKNSNATIKAGNDARRYRAIQHSCRQFKSGNYQYAYEVGENSEIQLYDRDLLKFVPLIQVGETVLMTADALRDANNHVFDEFDGTAGMYTQQHAQN
jgi:hypothetical protein